MKCAASHPSSRYALIGRVGLGTAAQSSVFSGFSRMKIFHVSKLGKCTRQEHLESIDEVIAATGSYSEDFVKMHFSQGLSIFQGVMFALVE